MTVRPQHRLRQILALGFVCLGTGGIRGQDTEGRMVVLPPFIVADKGAPLHWRYLAFDHFQILSVTSDSRTREFAGELATLETELRWMLPPEFRLQTSVPVTYLLGDGSMQQRLDQDLPAEMFLGKHGGTSGGPSQHFVTVPQLGLQDTDSYATFALLDGSFFQVGQMTYRADAMEDLLRRRTPPLPAWFVRGYMYFYRAVSFTVPGGDAIIYEPIDGGQAARRASRRGIEVVSYPFVWISRRDSQLLRDQVNTGLAQHQPVGPLLLPMRDLVEQPHPPAGTKAEVERYRRAWLAQSGLWVRWALDDQNKGASPNGQPWRDCFWTFVKRSSTEPANEAMFRECFGLGYPEMQEKLARYLPDAVTVFGQCGTEVPDPAREIVRDATPGEVARIKGDWERLEVASVATTFPALASAYQEHAHETLWNAYDQGDRDPPLLAAMGLLACDAGDDPTARPLLSAAVEAGVVRPRAYVEWSRLLYAEAAAKPLGAGGKLSGEQTAAILAPLAAGRSQSPPQAAAGELAAEVWLHSDQAPSASDLAGLDDIAFLFPHSASLTCAAAELEARAGAVATARRLVDRGLQYVAVPADRGRLIQLRALLENSGAGGRP
jgi:hypothetical protein